MSPKLTHLAPQSSHFQMVTQKQKFPDLLEIQNSVYRPCQFTFSEPQMELESSDYCACSFEVNGLTIRFRVAKTTPTKIGQFVTLWKRVGSGPTQPYDFSDPFDFFVISTRKDKHFGHFVFPKDVLLQQGVISEKGLGGKRGIRIYPPWDRTESKQAQRTQHWQLKYFLEIPSESSIDLDRAKMLYGRMKKS